MPSVTIKGLVWSPKEPDDMTYSVEVDGQFCYAKLPEITERVRAEGVRRGLNMGEMADFINRLITADEQRERERRGIPSVSFTTTIARDQMSAFAEMFGFEWQPPAQRTIDGDVE